MQKITSGLLALFVVLLVSIAAHAEKLVVKGFYAGMPVQEAKNIIEKNYASLLTKGLSTSDVTDNKQFSIVRADGEGMHDYIKLFVSKADNKVYDIRMGPGLVDKLFNIAGVEGLKFKEDFMKMHQIPKMDFDGNGWKYTSPEGYEVMLNNEKSLIIRSTSRK